MNDLRNNSTERNIFDRIPQNQIRKYVDKYIIVLIGFETCQGHQNNK